VILFENADVLVLDKPAGVSMATSSRPGSAEEAVRRLLAACGVPAPEPLPLLVHRLDVGTTGVVLLAKNDAAHRALSRALQQKTAQKTYRALVWGHPVPARGRIDLPLARDPKDGRKMAVREGGKPSVTRWTTLRRYRSVADLELTPDSRPRRGGRTRSASTYPRRATRSRATTSTAARRAGGGSGTRRCGRRSSACRIRCCTPNGS
jgi:23S rRNA-/tRNA-specific pseudouridylate synthase